MAASLELLGHKVGRVQEDELLWPTLASQVGDFDAQVVLWTRTWAVPHDECMAALAAVRDAGVPSAFYHLDRWWGLAREYQVASQPFFQGVDVVFSPDGGNDERWVEAGVHHVWLPPGVFGPEARRPGRRRSSGQPVVFVGTHPYPHAEWAPVRAAVIDGLRARYGRRFGLYPRGRPVRGQALNDLYAGATVVVGDSCLAGGATRYWSDRVPETLGRGGFLVHPEVEGLAEWYPDLPTYPVGDLEALYEQVDAALDPANAGARAQLGAEQRALVLDRDTYEHRMATVLTYLADHVGIPGPRASVPASPPQRPAAASRAVPVSHPHTRHRASFTLAQGDTDAIAVREVWNDDTYELRRDHVAGRTVIDVGANVGAFSVLAVKLGAAKVVALEPHPATHAALRANLEANGVADRVDALEVAVMGEPRMAVAMSGDGGGAFTTGAADGEVLVDTVAVATLLGVYPEVGFLKIDCEGGEYAILEGMPAEALAGIERIAMEFHGPGMPHLTHLDDGHHAERWGAMVAKLAGYGRLRIVGRPMVGGLLWWDRY